MSNKKQSPLQEAIHWFQTEPEAIGRWNTDEIVAFLQPFLKKEQQTFLVEASFASPAVSGQGMVWTDIIQQLSEYLEKIQANSSVGHETVDEVMFIDIIEQLEKLKTVEGEDMARISERLEKQNPYTHQGDSPPREPANANESWKRCCVKLRELISESPSTPSDNDFTFPFAKDKNGRWFYSYKDVNGLNQHSKSFDFYNHALEDYSKMRMVDESSTPSGEAEELAKALEQIVFLFSEYHEAKSIATKALAKYKYPTLTNQIKTIEFSDEDESIPPVQDIGECTCSKDWEGEPLIGGYAGCPVHDPNINKGESEGLIQSLKEMGAYKEPAVQKGEAVDQDELFDELVTKFHNSYNEVELALLKTQYKIIRK